MKQIWGYVKAATPVAQGFLGAALFAVVVYSGLWVRDRYSEFTIMRQVVGQLIDQSNKAAKQQEASKVDKP